MTKDEIIAMARQSGFDTYKNETAGVEGYDCTEELERFAALVAAKEREACAHVCESEWSNVALCERIDAYLDAARKQGGQHGTESST